MPTTEPESLAALDLGSNSVKLLLAHRHADGRLEERWEQAHVTRLAEGLAAGHDLLPAARERTLAAVRRLVAALADDRQSHGRAVACATSAVRDAPGGTAFLDDCARLLGGRPRLLSGDDEARTVFAGAASDRPADEFCICIDVGGGSTEIAAGPPGACVFHASIPIGCVRFSERFGLLDAAAPDAEERTRDAAAAALAPACSAVVTAARAHGTHPALIASGGTAATFSALQLALVPYDRHRVHGFCFSREQLAAWATRLLPMPTAARAACRGMLPDRAAALPAGLIILDEAMRLLRIDTGRATVRGLRYGMLLRLLSGDLKPTWTW